MTDLRTQDVATLSGKVFGGKADGLARLLGMGLAVPEAFAVSATTADPSRWSEATRTAFISRCRALLEHCVSTATPVVSSG